MVKYFMFFLAAVQVGLAFWHIDQYTKLNLGMALFFLVLGYTERPRGWRARTDD